MDGDSNLLKSSRARASTLYYKDREPMSNEEHKRPKEGIFETIRRRFKGTILRTTTIATAAFIAGYTLHNSIATWLVAFFTGVIIALVVLVAIFWRKHQTADSN
jgi:hypothetical protein